MSDKNELGVLGVGRIFWLVLLALVIMTGCGLEQAQPVANLLESSTPAQAQATSTATITPRPSPTLTPPPTATASSTPSPSPSATITPTPTITPTASITPTPTFAFPQVEVNKQAHCRYGPSTAYLHAADLYPGDTGSVRGRFAYSAWLYVKFDKLSYFCWVAPSVVDVSGDISTVWLTEPNLQRVGSNMYGPPQNVQAARSGEQVTITWDQIRMTEDDDRGYFIEAWVCQEDRYLWWTVSFPDQYTTSYTVTDEAGCPAASRGKIYTVEKHGYSEPVVIPWP
jgi:hypothetical protein